MHPRLTLRLVMELSLTPVALLNVTVSKASKIFCSIPNLPHNPAGVLRVFAWSGLGVGVSSLCVFSQAELGAYDGMSEAGLESGLKGGRRS